MIGQYQGLKHDDTLERLALKEMGRLRKRDAMISKSLQSRLKGRSPSPFHYRELKKRHAVAERTSPNRYSVPQNSFPLPTGSIFSFATLGSALGKGYAGAIVTLFCETL
jgi:hypothetical protein